MRFSFDQAFRSISHGFETRLVSERELEHAALLGDKVATSSRHSAARKRRGSVISDTAGLYF